MDGRYNSITVSPSPDCQRRIGQGTTLPAPLPSTMAVPAQQASPWFDLGLICYGEGRRPQLATRYGYSWDANKGRYVYGNRTELTSQDFDTSVMVQL